MKRLPYVISWVLIIAFVIPVLGCARTQPMLTPTFEVSTPDNKKVAMAIRQALINRDWTVTSEQPNRTEAVYRKGNEVSATVAVFHSGRQVSIKYVNSVNLLHRQAPAGPVIHKNYNRWVEFLEKDIQKYVNGAL